MILLRILDHDLHRYRQGVNGHVMWIETPAKASFLPAVVSLSTPRFAVSRKLTQGMIRSGVFKHDPDRLDEVIPDLMSAAYSLSTEEKWDNVHSSPKAAFDWLQRKSGTTVQPHALLVPASWADARLEKWAGKGSISRGESVARPDGTKDAVTVYRKVSRVHRCQVPLPVFLSRPDFVGMYTQILGGRSSILLHNVKAGMAFCAPAGGD